MHPNEGTLRAWLDGEVSGTPGREVETHLAGCPGCAAAADRLREEAARVAAAVRALGPEADELRAAPEREGARTPRARGERPASGRASRGAPRTLARWPRPAWAGLAAAATVLALWAFPPLRAAALDFIELFRVERVRVAAVDPGDLPERLEASERLARLLSDQVRAEPVGVAAEVGSSTEASELAGFPVRSPAALGAPSSVNVEPGAAVNVKVDLGRLRDLLRELGRSDIALPDGIDGKEIDIAIGRSVRMTFGDTEHPTILTQIPSPSISAPAGLPIERMGEAILQILGMTPEAAAEFSRSVDWSSTLVVPLPRAHSEYQEVAVDGTTGTLVRHAKRRDEGYLLLWARDGLVYALAGKGEPPAVEMSAEPRVAERAPAAGVTFEAFPNPARGEVALRYTLPADAAAAGGEIAIYDVGGRRVARYELGGSGPEGTVRWNGADERGVPAAPGLYYARLQAGPAVATTRISRVR